MNNDGGVIMSYFNFNAKPKFVPELDKEFRPAALENKAFLDAVEKSGNSAPVKIAVERGNGQVSTYNTVIFAEGKTEENLFYIERFVKTILWINGGWKVIIGGPQYIGDYIKKAYTNGGLREFDANFMSRIYEKEFSVICTNIENVPDSNESTNPIGRHLNGCRIGLDLGGSDRKVSAVIDGKPVYSEEVVWHPKTQTDPDYHYKEIVEALKTAASHMPRVDAVGVSAAGVYVDNRVMVASLFLKVSDELFNKKVKDILINAVNELGNIPLEVANDGDVTALAGSIDLEDTNVLGLAMGTSEAGGYVDGKGNITGWLNELAFVPMDYNISAMVDEWSGDYGCGVKYFSQDAVIKLAPAAGIKLDSNLTPAEKLKVVQELHEKGDAGAAKIFETIGIYLGYTIAYYANFYDIKHTLILGRVTSGKGGNIIIDKATSVLKEEFPELAKKINMQLPDESNRRVGQSIAAASLPKTNG
jgi:predicted NBD/HSP70 family sugar kinase